MVFALAERLCHFRIRKHVGMPSSFRRALPLRRISLPTSFPPSKTHNLPSRIKATELPLGSLILSLIRRQFAEILYPVDLATDTLWPNLLSVR